MATTQTHSRSTCLPSRLYPIKFNPITLENLKSLKISVYSEAIKSGLVCLAQLYNSVYQEITHTQKSLFHHQSMEESLSESVELLDSCNTIRELVQTVRENVQSLQSALRRKGLDSSLQNEVASFICLRKKMSKSTAKGLKALKNLEKKNAPISVNGDECSIRVLKEVSIITIAIFKCTFAFFSPPAIGWNLVSKQLLNKSMASGKDDSVVTEVGCVDLALHKRVLGVGITRLIGKGCKLAYKILNLV